MQLVRVVDLEICVLMLDADEEASVRAECERLRHTRAWAVGTDQKPCGAVCAQVEATLLAHCILERRAKCDAGARGFGLAGEPAHHARGVRGEEVVSRRGKVDVGKVWCIQTHARNAAHECGRQGVKQRDLVDRVLDDDSGGMKFFAHVVLLLEHDGVEAAARQRVRAR
jgi:hypothetical protein